MITQLFDEQLRDPTRVDWRGRCQAGDARVGQRNHDATAVLVCVGSQPNVVSMVTLSRTRLRTASS